MKRLQASHASHLNIDVAQCNDFVFDIGQLLTLQTQLFGSRTFEQPTIVKQTIGQADFLSRELLIKGSYRQEDGRQ